MNEINLKGKILCEGCGDNNTSLKDFAQIIYLNGGYRIIWKTNRLKLRDVRKLNQHHPDYKIICKTCVYAKSIPVTIAEMLIKELKKE